MNRFYVEKIQDIMLLDGDNHTHIAYSLRLRVGDEIELFSGDGYDYIYRITSIKKQETQVEFISKKHKDIETEFEIHAFISLIKSDKLSIIFQKLTELGVKEFHPMLTEYSQGGKKEFNASRYSRISIEACKQCGRSIVPLVNLPIDFQKVRKEISGYDLVVFAYENASLSIREYIRQQITYQRRENDKKMKVAILIGAEGGYSKREAEELVSDGILPVSLGKRILRAETAAVAATTAILYELDW